MTHVTCRLTAKNRDQLRNPTLGNRVCATFTFLTLITQTVALNGDPITPNHNRDQRQMPAVVIFWGSGLPVGGAGVNLRRPPRSGSNRLDSFLCVAVSSKASGLPLTRRPYLPFTLFNKILRCDYHILQSCLSDRLKVLCNIRKRHHNKTSNHDTGT